MEDIVEASNIKGNVYLMSKSEMGGEEIDETVTNDETSAAAIFAGDAAFNPSA
jgi:hypothetical protein